MEEELWKKKRREKGGKLWNKVKRGFLSIAPKEKKKTVETDKRAEHVFVVPCYGKALLFFSVLPQRAIFYRISQRNIICRSIFEEKNLPWQMTGILLWR